MHMVRARLPQNDDGYAAPRKRSDEAAIMVRLRTP